MEYYGSLIYGGEEYVLAHHGIKNQKWHVRRYQNEDGSLTPEGREHYNVGPPRKSLKQKWHEMKVKKKRSKAAAKAREIKRQRQEELEARQRNLEDLRYEQKELDAQAARDRSYQDSLRAEAERKRAQDYNDDYSFRRKQDKMQQKIDAERKRNELKAMKGAKKKLSKSQAMQEKVNYERARQEYKRLKRSEKDYYKQQKQQEERRKDQEELRKQQDAMNKAKKVLKTAGIGLAGIGAVAGTGYILSHPDKASAAMSKATEVVKKAKEGYETNLSPKETEEIRKVITDVAGAASAAYFVGSVANAASKGRWNNKMSYTSIGGGSQNDKKTQLAKHIRR